MPASNGLLFSRNRRVRPSLAPSRGAGAIPGAPAPLLARAALAALLVGVLSPSAMAVAPVNADVPIVDARLALASPLDNADHEPFTEAAVGQVDPTSSNDISLSCAAQWVEYWRRVILGIPAVPPNCSI